jgi:hypothetical protein
MEYNGSIQLEWVGSILVLSQKSEMERFRLVFGSGMK